MYVPTSRELEELGTTYKSSMPGATTWPTSLPLGHLATDGQRRKIVADLVQEGYWVKATGSRVTKSGYTSESD